MKINQLINKFLKKKSVKNGIWLYLLQIFNTVIPLLTLPYITRVLGANKYGVFSIAINIIGYYQVIVDYGFDLSATRKVSLLENDLKAVNKIYSSVIISRFILLAFSFLITIIYIILNINNINQWMCIVILMITLFGNCVSINWFFQGIQQMKYIAIVNVVSRSISVIFIFALVKSRNDLYLYCLLYSISPVISGVLGLIFAKRKFNIKFVHVTFNNILDELKTGWYVFTTQLSSKVFGAIGITFLGIFSKPYEVGIYSAIQKIPNILILAWVPIPQVLYPISSKKFSESFEIGEKFVNRIKHIFVPIFLLVAISISIFSKGIVDFIFGSDYTLKFYWMIPLLLRMVVAINNNFIGIQTLLAAGYDKRYSKCFQLGVFVTVLSNFLFIYFFKGNGASIAPLCSEVFLTFLLMREVKSVKMKYNEEKSNKKEGLL